MQNIFVVKMCYEKNSRSAVTSSKVYSKQLISIHSVDKLNETRVMRQNMINLASFVQEFLKMLGSNRPT